MKCPHCLVEFHDNPTTFPLGDDGDGEWSVIQQECPSCKRIVLHLACRKMVRGPTGGKVRERQLSSLILIRPKTANRPVPPEVPDDFSSDYKEACLVLPDSPKASAALSRRCLQHILRDKAGVKPSNLADEIQEVLDSGKLPSHLSEPLDGIRITGNFAAHPIKSTSTGEVLDVEPGEAEWNLDVLEMLFDFYFVAPAVTKKKRDALNKKLSDAGKPPMK